MQQIPQTLIRKHKILLNKIIMFILNEIFVIFYLFLPYIFFFKSSFKSFFVCMCFKNHHNFHKFLLI